jgi:hypothetical protein
MTIPKKDSRIITVKGHRYRYKVTGNLMVTLAVESNECRGQLLTTYFYHGLAITPGLVRQVIEYGLDHGWRPKERGDNLDLDLFANLVDF